MLQEHTRVKVIKDHQIVEKGSEGTIISVHSDAYTVEFPPNKTKGAVPRIWIVPADYVKEIKE